MLVVHKFNLSGEGTELARCAEVNQAPIAKLQPFLAHGHPVLVGHSTQTVLGVEFCPQRQLASGGPLSCREIESTKAQ